MAQKSAYRKEFAAQAQQLCALGAIDKQLAEFFGVTRKTIHNWKQDHPAFAEAVTEGHKPADARVVRSLYERALGYSHQDTDIRVVDKEIIETDIVKHFPPDTTACIFWLKNRLPDLWRDVHRTEHTAAGGGPVQVTDITDLEKARRIAFVLARAGDDAEKPVH